MRDAAGSPAPYAGGLNVAVVNLVSGETPIEPAVAARAVDDHAIRFREAMSHLASGVVLVTASIDGRPWSMTVSAACPVCLEPPTMLISLSSHTALAKAVTATGRFGVNILGAGALELARFGSAVGQPKFLDEVPGIEPGDLHPAELAVKGSLGHLDCEVVEVIARSTHSIFLGEVRSVALSDETAPLVHYRRDFWQMGQAA
jgi:flavin reductase (DIM6/NTAB) family NADH-FMN oxidoreductase RutF